MFSPVALDFRNSARLNFLRHFYFAFLKRSLNSRKKKCRRKFMFAQSQADIWPKVDKSKHM